jgi:hypothetical protein
MGNTSGQQRLSLKNEVQLNILIQSAMLQFLLKMGWHEECFTPTDFQIHHSECLWQFGRIITSF